VPLGGLVFTIIKVGGLIVLIIVGLFHIDFSNFAPFMPMGSGSIIPTMALLFWSFVGIETAVTVGEEADDPKTIRKSTFSALFTIIIVYGLTLFVAFGAHAISRAGSIAKAIKRSCLSLYG